MDEETEMDADGYVSPLVEAALALHEMFLALMRGGFTEMQALNLTGQALCDSQRED